MPNARGEKYIKAFKNIKKVLNSKKKCIYKWIKNMKKQAELCGYMQKYRKLQGVTLLVTDPWASEGNFP